MSVRCIAILLFVTLLVLACRTDNQSSPTSSRNLSPDSLVQKELHMLLENYYQTMSDRDWPAYKKFFWANATLTTVWQKPEDEKAKIHVATIDEFVAQTPHGPDSQPIFEEKMQSAEIEVRGNLAQVWAKYQAKFGSTDQLMEWEGDRFV